MPDDKEVKQDSKEAQQREADKERTKRERQQAVEEAAKSGFGTVYTDKDNYPKTGSQDPKTDKSSEPPSKDVKDNK